MSSRTIDIRLSTTADTKPLENYSIALGRLSASARGVGNVIAQTAAKFGDFGGVVGNLIRNVMRGGIWGVMMTAISEIWTHWKKGADEAAESSAKAVKKTAEGIKSAISEINSSYASAASSVDKWISKTEKQIEATKRLATAEKELEKQRALAAGDAEAAAKADEDIAVIAAKSAEEVEKIRVQGYYSRRAAASDAMELADREAINAAMLVSGLVAKQKAMLGVPDTGSRATGEQLNNAFAYRPDATTAWGRAEVAAQRWADKERSRRAWNGKPTGGPQWQKDLEDARMRFFHEEEAKLRKSAEWKSLETDIATATNAANSANQALEDARKRLEDIDAEESRRLTENKAKTIESKVAAAKKSAEESAKADIAAAQDAAKERDRLDREMHQRRMADLRAEIAAQKTVGSSLRALAEDARNEFERAFAMYRDPSRAVAEIGEEKDRAADLERLHRDARRYGGKWRIDELSSLMSAGDSQGVQSRLEEWRKSRRFSPEVEAMVRASAAERTQTTMTDELRKIESNTKGLADKLDALLRMK